MALRRSSRFGFPPPTPPASTYTVRMVPLSQGVHQEAAWPLLPPGSTISMTNMLPQHGVLIPRSRMSSLNTIHSLNSIYGLAPRVQATGFATSLWVSDTTRHGIIQSNGSISVGSFTSAFGLGIASVQAALNHHHYAQVYYPVLDENVLISCPGAFSHGSLVVSYMSGSKLLSSYLTGAPKAAAVGTFDNYVVAMNVKEGDGDFASRVQWCQRGSPSNWTQEGSGFEDLVEMQGDGSRVMGTSDGRLILFSTNEIWYGLPATYPAQFQFYPLDRSVGLRATMTAVDTEFGIIFLGSDWALRLLPKGGGASQVISEPIRRELVRYAPGVGNNMSWGMYDATRQLYYLYVDPDLGDAEFGLVLNVGTGEWGYLSHAAGTPRIGSVFLSPSNSAISAHLFFGDSKGTVYTGNANLDTENGVAVTATYRSAPIAADLPGNRKQMTAVDLDYRATSASTFTLKVSQDGGNTFETTGRVVSLPTAVNAGRVQAQMYLGGAFPAIELASTSTGYELHRVDATMNVGGRR